MIQSRYIRRASARGRRFAGLPAHSALVALAALLVPVAACSVQDSGGDVAEGIVGSVELALTVDGVEVTQVGIKFEKENPAYLRERSVDVSDPNATVSFAEHGLPEGSYKITLTADPADPEVDSCSGSVSGIEVVAGQTTTVNNLVLVCKKGTGGQLVRGGGVVVHADVDVIVDPPCPDLIDELSISPLQTSVGASVNLVAKAATGGTVAWSANAGSVSPEGSTFTCPPLAGQVKVRAVFSGASGCSQTVEETVSCVRSAEYVLGEGSVQTVSSPAESVNALYGIAFGDDGSFYTVGPYSEAQGADPSTAVTKFLADGSVDASFGQGGIAKVNIGLNAAETFRGITIQQVGGTSYIVVAGTTQFDASAAPPAHLEADTGLARFTLSGELDTSFGNNGIVRINMASGVPNSAGTSLSGNEAVWDLLSTPDGKLIVHGNQRNTDADGTSTPRTDADYALLRLNADGSFDTSFNGTGKVTLDLGGAGAGARTATLLPDGSVIGVGYTSGAPGVVTQNPVLYKLTPSGEFDATYATTDFWSAPGVWHDQAVPAPLRAEAYGATPQGNNFVTIGYGPPPVSGTSGTDFISLRYTADGAQDRTYGTRDGAAYIDGEGLGDNGRTRVVVLPDNQVVAAGNGSRAVASGSPANVDGMIVMLSEGGVPVESFGAKGRRLVNLGGANDAIHAAALSPDGSQVVFVGQGGTSPALKGVVLRLPLVPVE